MNAHHYLAENPQTARRLLVICGFTNAEIRAFSSEHREQSIALGILTAIECGCQPYVARSQEYRDREPISALNAMKEPQKKCVREFAAASFEEFLMPIDDWEAREEQIRQTMKGM